MEKSLCYKRAVFGVCCQWAPCNFILLTLIDLRPRLVKGYLGRSLCHLLMSLSSDCSSLRWVIIVMEKALSCLACLNLFNFRLWIVAISGLSMKTIWAKWLLCSMTSTGTKDATSVWVRNPNHSSFNSKNASSDTLHFLMARHLLYSICLPVIWKQAITVWLSFGMSILASFIVQGLT